MRLKQAEIRLWDTLLGAGQAQFDRYGAPADPYMTPVGYFNATRELAGMRRYLDDVPIRAHRSPDGFPQRLIGSETLKVTELTSRIASRDIAATLADLEIGFDPECDTSVRKRGWRSERIQARRKGREADPRAVELREREPRTGAVPATSMLQAGVDASRFGLMVVTGQPKNTAEYIQGSSRVGRDPARPGLVTTLCNWTRPRGLDHFEDFFHYHAGFTGRSRRCRSRRSPSAPSTAVPPAPWSRDPPAQPRGPVRRRLPARPGRAVGHMTACFPPASERSTVVFGFPSDGASPCRRSTRSCR